MIQEKHVERERLKREMSKIDRDVDAVIVEGYSDREVVRKLGFEGRVFMCAERTTEDLAEDICRSCNRVTILTDFDSHGKKLSRELTRVLNKDIDVVTSSRKNFGAEFTSTGRRAIEDAAPLFRSKQQKFVDAALDGLFFKS